MQGYRDFKPKGQRDRDRQTDRQTETERDRDRDRQRQRDGKKRERWVAAAGYLDTLLTWTVSTGLHADLRHDALVTAAGKVRSAVPCVLVLTHHRPC